MLKNMSQRKHCLAVKLYLSDDESGLEGSPLFDIGKTNYRQRNPFIMCYYRITMTGKTPLRELYGVGEKLAEKLALLGLSTVEDLLTYYPRKYEDYTNPRTIDQIVPGEHQIIKARILSIENDVSPRKRIKLTHGLVADATGQIAITWFNQPFLIRTLREGTTWLFAGKVEKDFRGNLTMTSPEIERDGKILAVYGETAGVTSKFLRKLISELRLFIAKYPDWLPDLVRQGEQLVSLSDAYEMIHFPEAIENISSAKKRLAFDELFLLIAKIQQSKHELSNVKSPICPIAIDDLKQFVESLPFTLTDSQKVASWEIVKSLELEKPMNRLLEGDVGSGKTVVGAIAAYVLSRNGYQTVWMAPTEILAQQHYRTCLKFLDQAGVRITLLTGSTAGKVRSTVNDFDLIIGTQAVIQDKVSFDRLGLIIVDEQHRFGVKQRARLLSPTSEESKQHIVPHFLAMTATPIPRTLALTIYGDLDISQLQSVPTGRLPIISRFISPTQRVDAYKFIRQQIKEGRQAFVVCPLVDGANPKPGQMIMELEEKKAAMQEYEKLSKHVFPDLNIGLIHGKMKPKEKEAIMTAFADKQIDILVATAVIEVGIDIPNATVMMIEGAERFGLAQLHQFRGRVGRSSHQSYCFVFTDSSSPAAFERLKAFTSTTSGFDLAELDLQLRGPGQLAGLQQSGIGDLKIASLSDINLIQRAKKAVIEVMADGLARYPLLVAKLDENGDTTQLA